MSRIALLAAFGCVLLSLPGNAQGEVSLQFLSFPKAANPEPIELFVGEGKTIEVDTPTNRISETYKVKAMANWALGETTVDKEGNPKFDILGKAASISARSQLILVIRNGNDNGPGLRLIPIPNDRNDMGGGTFTLINASGFDIGGKLSNKRFTLKPGKLTTVKPSPSRVRGVFKYCDTELYYRHGDTVKPFFSSTWRLNDKIRSFTFFYQDPQTQKLRIHSIRNFAP
jgi:hypothetical protein